MSKTTRRSDKSKHKNMLTFISASTNAAGHSDRRSGHSGDVFRCSFLIKCQILGTSSNAEALQ